MVSLALTMQIQHSTRQSSTWRVQAQQTRQKVFSKRISFSPWKREVQQVKTMTTQGATLTHEESWWSHFDSSYASITVRIPPDQDRVQNWIQLLQFLMLFLNYKTTFCLLSATTRIKHGTEDIQGLPWTDFSVVHLVLSLVADSDRCFRNTEN